MISHSIAEVQETFEAFKKINNKLNSSEDSDSYESMNETKDYLNYDPVYLTCLLELSSENTFIKASDFWESYLNQLIKTNREYLKSQGKLAKLKCSYENSKKQWTDSSPENDLDGNFEWLNKYRSNKTQRDWHRKHKRWDGQPNRSTT